jgi:hypothetical protein
LKKSLFLFFSNNLLSFKSFFPEKKLEKNNLTFSKIFSGKNPEI